MEAFNLSRGQGTYPGIPLPLGGELLAEFAETNQRIKFSLVGMERGQFIIAKIYSNDLIGTFRSESLKARSIELSYLDDEKVYGFSSEILGVVSSPARMFFMSYPKEIRMVKRRSGKRFDCILPAMTMIGQEILSVVIMDISRDGCQCVIRDLKRDNPVYDAIQVDKRIDLKVKFTDTGKTASINGAMRTVTRDDDRVVLGVMFLDVSPAVKAELDQFITH